MPYRVTEGQGMSTEWDGMAFSRGYFTEMVIDNETGVRMVTEHYFPGHPKIIIQLPDSWTDGTLSLEELNAAIQRCLEYSRSQLVKS